MIFAVWATAVQARLVWLQVHEHERLSRRPRARSRGRSTLPAMRGTITDREGRVLATSADADTVYAVPTEIDDAESTARKLCQVLEGCSSSKEQLAALGGAAVEAAAHSPTSSGRCRPRKPRRWWP